MARGFLRAESGHKRKVRVHKTVAIESGLERKSLRKFRPARHTHPSSLTRLLLPVSFSLCMVLAASGRF